jgi:hypothetical protein
MGMAWAVVEFNTLQIIHAGECQRIHSAEYQQSVATCCDERIGAAIAGISPRDRELHRWARPIFCPAMQGALPLLQQDEHFTTSADRYQRRPIRKRAAKYPAGVTAKKRSRSQTFAPASLAGQKSPKMVQRAAPGSGAARRRREVV